MGKEKFDYGSTLNLPVTDFPMRGNLPVREPETLKFWEEQDIYAKIQEKNKGAEKFILHDGPPYANGDIHLGHTLNKILKDIIIKYRSQKGYDAPYVPGWDTHGLPIELKAIKAMGLDHKGEDKVSFRGRCRDYALEQVEIQKEQFKRLGVRGDWENPYLTLHPEFEAEQIGVFGEMAEKGYIYKGLKPVNWCPSCETALAEAEIEYAEKRSPAIYVKFPVRDGKGVLPEKDTYIVIWTTTPWTLPANLGISVHPDYEYLLVDLNGDRLLVAKELKDSVWQDTGIEEPGKVVKTVKGSDLEFIVARNPLMDRDSLVMLGDHVTLEAGTGCVHTAPGHGADDFTVGKKYGLDILSPVDSTGHFTEEAGQFAGMSLEEGNKAVGMELEEKGMLLGLKFIKHQYPHCWRCQSPTIFRATEQWFASVDGFRKEALSEIEKTRFIPSWGKERIYKMISERNDWCISRQRTWGVPIPIFYCENCNEEIINRETIVHLQEIFRKEGGDAWFAGSAEELMPEGMKCPSCGGTHFRKETDIMDVWFDSGSSHRAVLTTREDLSWPADLYLEGSDQHRGWFNSSLCTSVATTGKAPYRAVLTHGFLVDEKGRKMSKSLGNGIDPIEVSGKMGADILRLWVSSADYRTDVAVSQGILKQVTEGYRKIRNTFRFMLGTLYDFDYEKHAVAYDDMPELDKWAVIRLARLTEKINNAYESYDFHVVYHAVHNFCNVDMSSFYLDVSKDRLYVSVADDKARRSAQTVIYKILTDLVRMITPVLSFTAEEVWKYLPLEGKEISVQLAGWPEAPSVTDTEIEERWERLLEVRDKVSKELEEARRAKTIGHSLNALVHLYPGSGEKDLLVAYEDFLAELFIVSKVEFHASEVKDELTVEVEKAPGEKCERCWNIREDVGSNGKYPGICGRCAAIMETLEGEI